MSVLIGYEIGKVGLVGSNGGDWSSGSDTDILTKQRRFWSLLRTSLRSFTMFLRLRQSNLRGRESITQRQSHRVDSLKSFKLSLLVCLGFVFCRAGGS